MNNIKNNRRAYKSRITRRIALQYIATLVGYVAVLFSTLALGWTICSRITWSADDTLYILLSGVRDYSIAVIGILVLIGWILITYYYMGKPLRYIDDVVSASEELVKLSDEQIILPDALKDVQDELNQVRETAIQNAHLAKEAEQRKNDLIVYLAHDLKTPLTSVIGYLTLLRDEREISPELREKYLSISLEKAERLEDLINEFFEITRFNLSNIELQYSRVNLTRMLEQLIFEFKPMLMSKGLELSLDAAPDIFIKCDVDKIQRVFDNLLRNAVLYSFENTGIEISVDQNDDKTVIKFINSGNTIPAEKLGRIFEQFYRFDVARATNSGGAGLGLAIAKQIVELHGGSIIAESADEKIEFTVTFPIS